MFLFYKIIYNSLRATRIRILSLESTTKTIPWIWSFSAWLVALLCHKSRYLLSPDMSSTSKSMPQRLKVSFLQPIVGVTPVAFSSGSIIRLRIVDLPALSSPISSSRAVELPIQLLSQPSYKRKMQFGDELPCGGYEDEDQKLKANLKEISEGKECSKQECTGCQKEKEEEHHLPGTMCKKCGSVRAVLVSRGEPICKGCLFKNIEYKCRLLLENSFGVRQQSNLLVCLSGGLNSICLLNVLLSLMKRYQKHKLFSRIGCLHIQQQGHLPANYGQIFQQNTGIPLKIIKLEDALKREGSPLGEVKAVLNQFQKNANSIDLVSVFRDRLILDYAEEHGFDFVMKGLNGQSLATEVFRYMGKGLGGCLPLLSSHDKSTGLFYYPLRNCLQKELQYYYHINGFAALAIKSDEDNIQNFTTGGLDDQIKQFVSALQHMYSHTAPAIVRTAEKIETQSVHNKPCSWCRLPAAEDKLCRRCLRVWQARKGTLEGGSLPEWMMID